MLDHILDEVLLAHLKTVPALAALNAYTGQDNADQKLPALTVSTTSEPLAGSDTAFRGEVSLFVESEAHDTTAAAHGERVEAVCALLTNRAAGIRRHHRGKQQLLLQRLSKEDAFGGLAHLHEATESTKF